MKQYKKLFAILFAALGVTTSAMAQTDVTDTYLTNAGFDDESGWITANVESATIKATTEWTCTSSGDTWYYGGAVGYGSSLTVNSVTPPATNPDGEAEGGALGLSAGWGCTVTYTQEVTLPAGVYTLTYKAYNANTAAAQAYNYIGFTSSSITCYGSTTSFTASTWTEESVSFTLTAETTGSISVGMGAISGGSGANAKLFVDGITLTYKSFNDVTESTPVDLTSMAGGSWANQSGSVTAGGVTNVSERFSWANNPQLSGEVLSMSVTNLPVGVYTIEVYCASSSTSGRDNTSYVVTDGDEQYTSLTANDNSIAVPTYNRTAISGDLPYYTFEDLKITDGNLNLAVNVNVVSPNWLLAKVKSITYLGPDKSLYEEAFNTKYSTLQGLTTSEYPTAFAAKITDLISRYNVTASDLTLSELESANAEMDGVLNVHASVKAEYANLNTLITLCESYSANSEPKGDAKTTFDAAINTAKTAASDAVTVSALTEAYPILEAARQTYTLNAFPINDVTFDLTFKANTTWVNGGNNYTAGGVVLKEKYAEQPWTGAVMSTSYTDVPNGTYDVQIYCNANACEWNFTSEITDGDENTSVTANDVIVKVPVYKLKSNSTANVITLNDVVVKDHTINIAINNDAIGANWILVNHKSLTLKAADITGLQASVTELKTEAQGISGKMNSEVQTNLANAISSADATATNPYTLEAMIADLQEGIDAANTAIKAYENLNKAIEMTKAFVDASELTSYETMYSNNTNSAAEVETARQELNVMRFNAASAVFTNKIEVADWVGTMGTRSDQHWSGNTVSYYDANSWGDLTPDALTKEIALTKGTYVLKVAGRTHANATLTLEVLDQVITFHSKGDEGYGITKAGNACFSPDSTYANDNKGRGWEWEFLKFELDTDQTVELKVNSNYNNIWQVWTSFGDITLWMDDATYVTVYGDAVNAPLAEAKALVGTKPLGAAENEALEEAIALGEGEISTPAQLNTAVDALKKAIDNANAWRSTYNTEKGELVAALERFEADYNDAENGALDYMNKERWATAIAKAQAAAVAKDNLTSHAILTTATTELTAALDAATVSVGEYADLEAAITEANALAGANIGDNPFQRPQSAADALATTEAQSIYDTAEADGEGVTTKTTALEEAITTFNNTALNAPGDALFNVIINGNEGYKFNGRAVTFKEGATAENYSMGYTEFPGSHYNQAVKFIAAEAPNCYYLSFEDADGTTYYIGTGKSTGFGSDDAQIRSTADQAKAIPFRIESSTQDGIYYVWNTVINKRIGGNGSDNTGLYTAEQNSYKYYNFNLRPAAKVTPSLNISSAEWATLILPFNAALPEDVIAYSCEETDGESLTLAPAESIVANTPYLVSGKAGTYNFSGYGLAEKNSYTDGLFVGTYVNYTTTANSNTYVLQNGEEGLAFYHVGEGAQPMVKAYRCYMIYEAAAGAPVFRIGKGTTGITPSTLNAQPSTVIYDLMGRKVTTMMKGGMYIVNGKKVVIR